MDPLVSIIIASYNHAQFIKSTLDSVTSDTYPNKEIVIIDDGSVDHSADIIHTWIGSNPNQQVTFIARDNKGLCATLNELVEIAKGKYVLLLASDDFLVNNTIAERVEILEKSSKMVLVSDAEVIDNNGKLMHSSMLSNFHSVDKTKYYNADSLLDEVIFKFSISGAVVIMNKDIFRVIGKYPPDLKAEDLYFYMQAAITDQLQFYDKIVSKYRIHENNTSGENPELLLTILKTYKRLFFKIPGFTRKIKLIKRCVGIGVKAPTTIIKALLK